MLISNELIRAAILLSESWYEAIEEASRIYFGNNDAEAMIDYLKPYHKGMENSPETMNEISFYQGYASELKEAEEWSLRYMKTKDPMEINQAWDLYF
jgi:FKBP12-rapamycin complex-associated protein